MQPSPTGPLEFPAEMVFVPSFDEEPVVPMSTGSRVLPDPIFEDEEADDEFEQSLSGLRLDEEDEDGQVRDPERFPEAVGIELQPEASAVEKPPFELKSAETVSIEPAHVEPTISGIPVALPANRRLITATLFMLFGLISFAAGALATMLIFEMPQPIPDALDLPVAHSVQPANVSPDGMVLVPGGGIYDG
jgi:hypothetical protein